MAHSLHGQSHPPALHTVLPVRRWGRLAHPATQHLVLCPLLPRTVLPRAVAGVMVIDGSRRRAPRTQVQSLAMCPRDMSCSGISTALALVDRWLAESTRLQQNA